MTHKRITAGIISWDGMHDAALAVATAIRDAVDDLVVVYSNADEADESGPGRWVKLPQSAFFGAKFAALLPHVTAGDALLLVQADACSHDWPGLAGRFRELMLQRPDIGVWSPNIDYTPFPNAMVATGSEGNGLYRVLQTDGIVLGLHPRAVQRLARLDYAQNNLGWGIDWAAIGFSIVNNLLVVRDSTRLVLHPRSRGYDGAAAMAQMEAFLRQLDAGELAAVQSCRQRIDLQAIRMNNLAHVTGTTNSPAAAQAGNGAAPLAALGSQVEFLVVENGRVLLAPVNKEQAFLLRCSGQEVTAVPRRDNAVLPKLLSLATDCGPDAQAEPSDAPWSCPGQPTLRYVFRKAGPLRVDLLKSVGIDAGLGSVCLRMGTAMHRADASLLLEWHDASDPSVRNEKWIKLDRRFNGNAELASYQKIAFAIPDTGDTRILTLSLHYWTKQPDPKKPGIVFCTRPYLLAADGEAATSPLIQIAAGAKGDCVPEMEIAIEPGGGDVTLVTGGQEYLLIAAANGNVRILDDAGVARAQADAPVTVTLFINGTAVRPLWVGPEPLEIPVPVQRQAGPGALIELRDATGSVVLASHQLPAVAGQLDDAQRHPDAWRIDDAFDAEYYLAGFAAGAAPEDPVSHYLAEGWRQGRDPAPWFSTWHYLAMHPDIAASGMNPFLHYCIAGQAEGRRLANRRQNAQDALQKAHEFAVKAGPHFEEFDPAIGVGRRPRAKVLAYFLPQFHAVPVNDENWGRGFTEWRNLPRALPRFEGHIQPRIPRDLGHYNLADSDVLRRQISMAKAAGLHGFCFYHYWFDGKRVLERPMEQLLADPTLDFPFCLMWANENWTRTWDGMDREVILKQSYRDEDTVPFVDDLARHMKDARYIRIGNRPLFFIYRPGQIPAAKETIARWRELFRQRHDLEPLIFHAQGFSDNDPRPFGLDGAIEFPPHKILPGAPDIAGKLALFSPDFAGDVRDYATLAAHAMSEPAPEFPLIRTVFPSWDNDARRPNRSTILAHSTPAKFAQWLDWAVAYSQANNTYGESFVCVNAWNEWAEGAYLEPDVHFGGAYLNALSRIVHGVTTGEAGTGPCKLLLVGHDARNHGAQQLLIHIGETLRCQFGIEVTFLIVNSSWHDEVVAAMKRVGTVLFADEPGTEKLALLAGLHDQGYRAAITNTTVSGRLLPALKRSGFRVLSLIHELPTLLAEYKLEDQARAIASLSDGVIFPADIVRSGFETFAGRAPVLAEVFPQGLYNTRALETAAPDSEDLRSELGLRAGTKIVLGVGYADLRKGIDRFVAVAISLCRRREDLAFVWAGLPAPEASNWLQPEINAAGLANRIRILGHRDDIARFYAAADAYYLASREDPFPSVVLEALAAGLPVIGHRGCGGCDELIARHGVLVDNDPLAVIDAINTCLDRPRSDAESAAAARRREIAENFRFDSYVFGLAQRLLPALASVSAVVPNYNYEAFIGARLRSVFDQTFPLREVLVLDDASPDASVAVITATAAAANRRIELIVNAGNSGSPFPQWRKGVTLARGDYVWIAEADDLAAPEFVESLVRRMQASGAVLGFCDSRQIDEKDAPLGESYKPYINQEEPGVFDRAFDMSGPEFLARHLAVKNVILNVSGVVFRRDALLDAFDAVGDALFDFRVAGDWRLYIELCRKPGSRVSYLPEAMNVHRRHRVSVTHALNIDRHLEEIATLHRLAGEFVALDALKRRQQEDHLNACSLHLRGKPS